MVGFKDVVYLEAKDGKEAYDLAVKNDPALILADLNMPIMDGEQLIQKVKGNQSLAKTPMVVVTSAANPVRKERLLSLGAFGVIPKPVSPASIREGLGALTQQFCGG